MAKKPKRRKAPSPLPPSIGMLRDDDNDDPVPRRGRPKVDTNCGPAVIHANVYGSLGRGLVGSWWRYDDGPNVLRVDSATTGMRWTRSSKRWEQINLSDSMFDFPGDIRWRQINNTTAAEIVGIQSWATLPPLPLSEREQGELEGMKNVLNAMPGRDSGVQVEPGTHNGTPIPPCRDTAQAPVLSNQSKRIHGDLHIAVRWFESLAKEGRSPNAVELDVLMQLLVGVLNRIGSLDQELKNLEARSESVAVVIPPPKPVGDFGYEWVNDSWRITDKDDNRVATCYDEGNAQMVTAALNGLEHAPLLDRAQPLISAMTGGVNGLGAMSGWLGRAEKWLADYHAMLDSCRSQPKL